VNCIHWRQIKDLIPGCNARNKIVILDCCFSGGADDLLGSEEDVIVADLNVSGTVVLTSSPRNRPSIAKASDRRTTFTEALLGTIEFGMDTGRAALTVDEIFAEAKAKLRSIGAPEPKRVSTSDANNLRLFLNNASRESRESSSLDHMLKQIETRMEGLLSSRIDEQVPLVNREGVGSRRIVPFFMLAFFFLAFFEVWWLWFVGHPVSFYDSSDNQTWKVANSDGFRLSLLALLALSIGGALLGILALRSTTRSAVSAVIPLRYLGATLLARLCILNSVVVIVSGVVIPSLHLNFYS
jgi:hypothetical protein